MFNLNALLTASTLLLTTALMLPSSPAPVVAKSAITPNLSLSPSLTEAAIFPVPAKLPVGEFAQAQPSPSGQYPGPRSGLKQQEFFQELNLTPPQQQQLRQIQQKYNGQISAVKSQLEQAQQKLATMMTGNSDDDAIRAQHNEVIRLRQTLDNTRFESLLEMRAVLTQSQRQQMTKLIQQYKGRRGRRSQ